MCEEIRFSVKLRLVQDAMRSNQGYDMISFCYYSAMSSMFSSFRRFLLLVVFHRLRFIAYALSGHLRRC